LSTSHSPTTQPCSWRLRPAQQVRYRQWDDEFVVFNDLSGACHLIDSGGFAVLELLQGRPEGMAAAAMVAQLKPQFDDPEQIDLGTVALILANLSACELVEACS
jgi:PqqD family protein of HPr-rel-A system